MEFKNASPLGETKPLCFLTGIKPLHSIHIHPCVPPAAPTQLTWPWCCSIV